MVNKGEQNSGKLQEEVVYEPTSDVKSPQELKPQNSRKNGNSLFLYFSSFAVNQMAITTGILVTWISPMSSRLLSNDPDINPLGVPITTFQMSLIGSMNLIGGLIGPSIWGRIFDICGRRITMITIFSCIVVAFPMLAFAKNIYLYYTLLTFLGMCSGGGIVGTSMYSSEIAEDHNRAKITCFIGLAIPTGNLFSFVLGPFFSFKVFTLLCMLPSLFGLIAFVTILPESPVYLISKGDRKQALRALEKLRNKNAQEIEGEFENIEYTLKQSTNSEKSDLAIIFRKKSARKAFIISAGISTFGLLSGIPAIMSYLELIFTKAGTNIAGSVCTIISGLVQVICIFCSSLVVDKWGRRPLLLTSSSLCSVSLFLFGLFFYLKDQGSPIIESIEWMPIVSVIFFLVVFSIGLASLPLSIASEIFPNNIKSLAVSLIIIMNYVVAAVIVFSFPIITETFGFAWTFWVYSANCLLAFIFIYKMLPETKGKTLLEIQAILSK